ncbi:transcriptional regulator [SAR116 cluster alpha proteobacterium HIMB100]|nr:transcriptional regulator [SAR116 cluster alpha proteobacterium HIMB100]
MTNSQIYDLNQHLTYRIARLQAKLSAQASELLKDHLSLSLSEWRALAVLYNPEVETQKDVLLAMGLDKGQISRTIKRLEEKGLIQTDKSTADNRLRKISLTPSGVDTVDKMFPIMMQRQAHLQNGFTSEELKQLFNFLNRLEEKSGHLNF